MFSLCGVPLLFLDQENPDQTAAQIVAGTASLFIGGFALALAWNALETSQINIQHARHSRGNQPRRFAVIVLLILAAGIVTLVATCWLLFFK